MKVWGSVRCNHRIRSDVVETFMIPRDESTDWDAVISQVSHALDLARPVILPKHIRDMQQFTRTVFKPGDFIEPVDFDAFEVVVFPEEKKKDKAD